MPGTYRHMTIEVDKIGKYSHLISPIILPRKPGRAGTIQEHAHKTSRKQPKVLTASGPEPTPLPPISRFSVLRPLSRPRPRPAAARSRRFDNARRLSRARKRPWQTTTCDMRPEQLMRLHHLLTVRPSILENSRSTKLPAVWWVWLSTRNMPPT